jgi:hypothetical protein
MCVLGKLGIFKISPNNWIKFAHHMNSIYTYIHTLIYGTLQDSMLFWLFVCNYNQVAFTIWDPSRLLKLVCLFVCNLLPSCFLLWWLYCMGVSMVSHVVHVANHQRQRSIKVFKSMIQVKWKERKGKERKAKQSKGSNKTIWRKHST